MEEIQISTKVTFFGYREQTIN